MAIGRPRMQNFAQIDREVIFPTSNTKLWLVCSCMVPLSTSLLKTDKSNQPVADSLLSYAIQNQCQSINTSTMLRKGLIGGPECKGTFPNFGGSMSAKRQCKAKLLVSLPTRGFILDCVVVANVSLVNTGTSVGWKQAWIGTSHHRVVVGSTLQLEMKPGANTVCKL